jgi:hypothetical protein
LQEGSSLNAFSPYFFVATKQYGSAVSPHTLGCFFAPIPPLKQPSRMCLSIASEQAGRGVPGGIFDGVFTLLVCNDVLFIAFF